KRHFQFGIRHLLILTIAVAAAFSWLAVETKTTREQAAAVEAIYKLGGGVAYDFQPDSYGHWILEWDDKSRLHWLRSYLGGDFFSNVVGVSFSGDEGNDTVLEQLAALPYLEELNLRSSRISDKGLKYITSLAKLRVLLLDGSNVGDAGLEHLARLMD